MLIPNKTKLSFIRLAFVIACSITFLIFLYSFINVGFGVYGDGMGYFAPMRSLLFDGNLDISNEYRHFAQTPLRWPHPIPETSKYPIGLGLVLLPFYVFGHGVALLLNFLGFPVFTNGLSWPYELFFCSGSVGLGILGLFFCYRGAKASSGVFPAFLATIGIWFASPLSYYLIVETSMSHAVSQFLISGFLLAVSSRKWLFEKKYQILLGILLGLATLVRLQDFIFIVVPVFLLFSGWGKIEEQRSRLSPLLVIGGTAAILLVPQMLLYMAQFGSLRSIPYLLEGRTVQQTASFSWLQPKIVPVLFSGFHGLFTWHPLTLMAVVGLLLAIRKDKKFIFALMICLFLQVYVISSWHCWWQGASVGGRMFSSSSYIFVIGLAALWEKGKSGQLRLLFMMLTLGLMLWNALLVLQYMSGMIPSLEPVSVRQLFSNQYKVIPYLIRRFLIGQ